MLRNFVVILAALFLLFAAPGKALALCAGPAGNAGESLYNSTQKQMQYCDGTNWISMGKGPESGGGCASPAGTAGEVLYNSDYRVMQYCNSHEWVAMSAPAGAGAPGWIQVSAGGSHTCGIKSDNTLWCWGRNDNGQVGDNSTTKRDLYTAVNGGGTWKQVSTGGTHTCGIKSDDTLLCWGDNASGQLGDNTSGTNRLIPTAVNGGGTWKQVSAGGVHTCGIKSDDTLLCWGSNNLGQIGDNTSGTNRLIPTAINGGGTWKQVSSRGYHSCGIKSDNTLWCWGYNDRGRIGDGTCCTNLLVPTAVSGGGTWKLVSAGGNHTCAVKSDDTLWCWGGNNLGGLGDGTQGYFDNKVVPTAVSGGGTWKAVAAGSFHTCAIKSNNTLWCWGENQEAELGDTTTIIRSIPTASAGGGTSWSVLDAGGAGGSNGGSGHSCAITNIGTLFCWGVNINGQLGIGTSIYRRLAPVPVGGTSGTWSFLGSTGSYSTCAIKSDNSIWCWGDGINGTDIVPTPVNGGGTWKFVATSIYSHNCGIKSDDTLWCWGYNQDGELGDNTYTDSNAPVSVDGGGTWKDVAAGGFHTCGIKSDDTLWCWGANWSGQLGDNTGADSGIPVSVSGGGAWKSVAAGEEHTCAIKSDDTLWCWGNNTYGRLGDNSMTQRDLPTTVNGGGSWKQVSASAYHTCGIKSDDTLLCWGWNGTAQIGDGTITGNRLVPTSISGGGTWKIVRGGWYHTCAIKSDDTLFCWGRNDQGEVGNNTQSQCLSPTALYGGGTWKSLKAGDGFTCAIKSDGIIWCWGIGDRGQLGDPEVVAFRSSPQLTACPSPAGKAGDMLFNTDFAVMQFCNSASWVGIGK
jgi:alpha-tubulin suppressor-like RCC1 family protein